MEHPRDVGARPCTAGGQQKEKAVFSVEDPAEVTRETSHEREGHYSNYFKVGFNSFEFILDFGQAYEGGSVELHHTRIITGPVYAKALGHLLLDSLAAYERTCGPIPEIAPVDPPATTNDHGGP